ncbi:ABC-2 family transporter protein [Paraliobacillus sp. PM-2]|uniref:ABC transporter permease n=1 Tax=Paraliobacillus sp. PM-2 TaxID=1462524 RepID=UPI00061C7AA6|nr:ABC transporter permease [Paraliobacillus sp. PM-2]CQR47053.1 ABC-2 family transporter protein [Paraliobacillus sp. PM-2]
MNKFWIVLAHTYWTRFKSKSFIITTAIFLLFIIGIANIQSIIELFDRDNEPDVVAVIDETDSIYSVLSDSIEQMDNNFILESYEGSLQEAEKKVQSETYVGVLKITYNENDLPVGSYHTNQLTNTSISTILKNQLQQIKVAMATNQAGVDQAVIESIYAPVNFDTVPIESSDGTTAKTEEELSGARGLVYAMLFLLYMTVLTYGNMIAMDVANEKSSRVMEILISSSSPVSQMFAKISGIALLGLTQIATFIIAGYVLIKQKQDELVGGMFAFFGLSDIQISTFVYAVVFFLLGYLLYATLSAMLGSLVSRMEDVQQIMMPVILLVVIAFMVSIFGLNAPDNSFITITSYIPFFTPMVMFLRVGMLDIPFWEVGLGIGIMIVTITIFAIIGARIYRGGVLMYGRSSSLKDFKQAMQLSKKE